VSEAEATWWLCGECKQLNVGEDMACVSCGVSRPIVESISRPFVESDREGLLSLIAGATLLVFALAGILLVVVRGRDPRNFDNLFVNSPGVWLIYALLTAAIPTQIAAIVLVVVLRRHRMRGGSDLQRKRIGVGRALGIVGGFITIVGVFLPWATISYSWSSVPSTIDSLAATFGFLGAVVLLLGLIGTEYVALPTEGTAVAAAVFGALALQLTLAVFGFRVFGVTQWGGPPNPYSYETSPGSGLYVSTFGSLVLIVGSALAFLQARTAAARTRMAVFESQP